MFAMRFHNKKETYFLSTIHSLEEVASRKLDKDGRSVKMLRLISDYNKRMRGIDKNDTVITNHSCVCVSHTNGQQKCFPFY